MVRSRPGLSEKPGMERDGALARLTWNDVRVGWLGTKCRIPEVLRLINRQPLVRPYVWKEVLTLTLPT